MKHEIYYDSENDLVRFDLHEDYMLDQVPAVKEKVLEVLEGKPYRQMLITTEKSHKFENRETREKTNQIIHETGITDMAFIGASAAVRMILKVILKSGDRKTNGNFFKTQEEGIKWLKEQR